MSKIVKMRVLFTLFSFIGVVIAAKADNSELSKTSEMSVGVKIDNDLFGRCRSERNVSLHFEEEVKASKECIEYNDYRCFKACQFAKMEISDKDGNIDGNKFKEHFEMKLKPIRSLVSTRYVTALLSLCLDGIGKKLFYATKDCNKNERMLKCLISIHYMYCMPNKATTPGVPTTME